MKIYFDFGIHKRTLVCHEIAKYWKEHYGIEDYAGIVAVKNGDLLDFLNNQEDIKYHFIDNRDAIEEEALKIKLDMDRIDEIEKKLDIPLWHFVVADRNMGHFFVKGAVFSKTPIMSLAKHENIMKWVVYYYDLFDRRLEEFKPDAVVFLSNASLPSLMLAKICEIKKIPYYELTSSRIGNLHSVIRSNYRGINKNIIEDYKSIINSGKPSELISQFASEYVDSFKQNPVSPEEYGHTIEESKKIVRQGVVEIIAQGFLEFARLLASNFVSYFNRQKSRPYLRRKKMMSSFFVGMRKKLILGNSMQNFFNDGINYNDRYVFFPLHLDPEASTMIYAPNFVNQLNLIDILAKNIPLTHKLYIKEHIPNIGTRPKEFYNEIKKYPNAKLISPWADTFDLIKNSSLVVTISGTAGFEAALMNIPVIIFSRTFYSEAGLAVYCPDMDKLGKEIKNQIFEKRDMKEQNMKARALITAIHKNSFKIDATSLIWEANKNSEKDLSEKKDDIRKIAEKFYNEIIANKP
jgi:hypothetical protein